jgi:hypothetical protein
MDYKTAILALFIAVTVGLVVPSFRFEAAAEVESGMESDKTRNRGIYTMSE